MKYRLLGDTGLCVSELCLGAVTTTTLLAILLCCVASAVAGGQTATPQQGQGQPAAMRAVTIAAIPGVIAADAVWTRAWQGTDNADGLVGMPDGSLLFAQEQPSRIARLDVNDTVSVYAENTDGAGAVALDAGGRLVAVERTCTDPGLRAPCSEPTLVGIIYPDRERKALADRFQGRPLGRLNDLVIDRRGGVYLTDSGTASTPGGAYAISAGGTVTSIGQDLRTNGIMLSRDEKTLYVTNGSVIVSFDVEPDGTVTHQRDFGRLEAGGAGDGMAIDAAGRLYVTSAPGVQVLSPEGRYLGLIPTPRNVISVAFAGRDKKTLYVVGSGALNAEGQEIVTPAGVRNNAKSIFRIPLLAQGFAGRAK